MKSTANFIQEILREADEGDIPEAAELRKQRLEIESRQKEADDLLAPGKAFKALEIAFEMVETLLFQTVKTELAGQCATSSYLTNWRQRIVLQRIGEILWTVKDALDLARDLQDSLHMLHLSDPFRPFNGWFRFCDFEFLPISENGTLAGCQIGNEGFEGGFAVTLLLRCRSPSPRGEFQMGKTMVWIGTVRYQRDVAFSEVLTTKAAQQRGQALARVHLSRVKEPDAPVAAINEATKARFLRKAWSTDHF